MNIGEIITESRRDEYFRKLYIDTELFKKQRIQYTLVGFIIGLSLGVAFYMALDSLIISVLMLLFTTVLGSYIGWKFMYMKLMSSNKAQESQMALMFPEFLQTFTALLYASPSSGIVSVIESTIPYLRQPIRQQTVKLVNRMYQDGTNLNVRNAIMEFSAYIGTSEARRIMSLIYNMYVEGSNPKLLDELDEKVSALNENKVNEYVSFHGNALSNRSFWSIVLALMFILGFAFIVGGTYVSQIFKFM